MINSNNYSVLKMENKWAQYLDKAMTGHYNPNIRRGQHYMNILAEMDIELHRKITGTKYDCFYSDEVIPEFLLYVGTILSNK